MEGEPEPGGDLEETGEETPPLQKCFMCLKRERIELGPSFAISERIKCFEPLLRYLTGAAHHPPSTGDEEEDQEEGGEGDPLSLSILIRALKATAPVFCGGCCDIMGKIFDLHQCLLEVQRQIEVQTGIARSVIKRSYQAAALAGPQPEDNLQEEEPENGPDLLSKFRREILVNYNNQVLFPSQLAPNEMEQDLAVPPVIDMEEEATQASPGELQIASPPASTSIPESGLFLFHPTGDGTVLMAPILQPSQQQAISEVVDDTLSTSLINVPSTTTLSDLHLHGLSTYQTDQLYSAPPGFPSPVLLKTSSTSSSSPSLNLSSPPPPPPPPLLPTPMSSPESSSSPHPVPSPTLYHPCDVCGAYIPKPIILTHLINHVGCEFVFHCESCQVSYLTPYRLQAYHQQRFNTSKTGLQCPTYDPLCFQQTFLQCERCPFQADSLHTLKHHVELHESQPRPRGIKKKMKCPLCPSRFALKVSCLIHLQDHHILEKGTAPGPDGPRRIVEICELCDRELYLHQLQGHLQISHGIGPELAMRCGECPAAYSSLKALIEHQVKAKSWQLHEISCHLCCGRGGGGGGDKKGGQFKWISHLRNHYFQRHHLKEKFLCQFCQKVFHSAKVFEAHGKICGGGPGGGMLMLITGPPTPPNGEGGFGEGGEVWVPAAALEQVGGNGTTATVTSEEDPQPPPPSVEGGSVEGRIRGGGDAKKKPAGKRKSPPGPRRGAAAGVSGPDSDGRRYQCRTCGQRFRHQSNQYGHERAHRLRGDKFKPIGRQKKKPPSKKKKDKE